MTEGSSLYQKRESGRGKPKAIENLISMNVSFQKVVVRVYRHRDSGFRS